MRSLLERRKAIYLLDSWYALKMACRLQERRNQLRKGNVNLTKEVSCDSGSGHESQRKRNGPNRGAHGTRHRSPQENYRLRHSTVELCKIARLFMRTEEGLGDGLDDD